MPTTTARKKTAALPTEDDIRTSLTRVLGDDEGENVWKETCRNAQIPRPGPALTPDEVLQISDVLCDRSDMGSVVGNSLSVKVRTSQSRR